MKAHLWVILLASLIFLTDPASARKSPLELIDAEYHQGELTYGESLILKLQSVRAPNELPQRFKTEVYPVKKSATEIMLEAVRNLDRLSPSEQNTAKDYLARPPSTHAYDSPGGFFKIHYSISGAHAIFPDDTDPANGIPDLVEWVADYCDSAYNCQTGSLGYLAPPSDGTLGGDDKYDIYLIDMPYYGYCQPESEGPEEWPDWISYMAMNNEFIDFPPNDDPEGDQKGAARVTAAHEFFHAVQFAYTNLAESWYMEVSSTWMEEICYPLVNDNYNYLDDFFDSPHLSLYDLSDNHEYGAFVFNIFLDQNFDTLLIRSIWEDMRYNTDALQVINSNLQEYNSDLYSVFNEFALWNWCTGGRDDGLHYPEGASYPVYSINSAVSIYPTGVLEPPLATLPGGLAANYIKYTNPDQLLGDMLLTFDGQDGVHWDANVILAQPGNNYIFTEIQLNEARAGSLLVQEIENYEYILLVPTVKTWYGDDFEYTYTGELYPWPDYGVAVADIGPYQIYSNNSRDVEFKVYNRGQNMDIFHFDISDELGWDFDLYDTLLAIPLKDSAYVQAQVISSAGILPGTINNIILSARANSDSTAVGVDSLPMATVRFNGDSNNDGTINVSDAVWIINFVFTNGDEPRPELYAGDANCDGDVNVSDAVHIINYVFAQGPQPPCWVY